MTLEERINKFVGYDEATGSLFWREKPNRNIRVGAPIGRPNSWGHWCFSMNGRTLMVHRVVWFLHHGQWPVHQIDHIDRDKANNRIENLRDVEQATNMQNQSLHRRNSSGLLGAHRNPNSQSKPWEASIKANGKRVYIGRFETAEEAHMAYLKAKEIHHGR